MSRIFCARGAGNAACAGERDRASAITQLSKSVAEKYSTILTRYPLMDRADDAKKRLEAMHEPVPRPTKAAVARNKAEIDSRGQVTIMQWAMGLIKKGRLAGNHCR